MKKKRIGLIVPSSNTMMEEDFIPRMPNKKSSLHIARMFIEHTTREEEERMVDIYFPQAMHELRSADVDVILFGCTSAGTLKGNDTEHGLEEEIFKETGKQGITVTRAITSLLREMGAEQIVLFTPYIQDLTDSVRDWLLGEGFEVVLSKGMGIINNTDIGSVSSRDIVDFSIDQLQKNGLLEEAEDGMLDLKADAILYSCTNFPSWGCLDEMKKHVRTNYITSNQALFEYTMKLLELTAS